MSCTNADKNKRSKSNSWFRSMFRKSNNKQNVENDSVEPKKKTNLNKITSFFKRKTTVYYSAKKFSEDDAAVLAKTAKWPYESTVRIFNVKSGLDSASISDAGIVFAEKNGDTNVDVKCIESINIFSGSNQVPSTNWTKEESLTLASAANKQNVPDEAERKISVKHVSVEVTPSTMQTGTQCNMENFQNDVGIIEENVFVSHLQKNTNFVSENSIETSFSESTLNREQQSGLKLKSESNNKNDGTLELNKTTLSYENWKQMDYMKSDYYIHIIPIKTTENRNAAMNLVYKLNTNSVRMKEDVKNGDICLIPLTNSFRKEIDEALRLLKCSSEKLRKLATFEETKTFNRNGYDAISPEAEQSLGYFKCLNFMYEDFCKDTPNKIVQYWKEFSKKYDEARKDSSFYLMKPRSFDMTTNFHAGNMKDFVNLDKQNRKYFEDIFDDDLFKEIKILENVIDEITKLENKIKKHDILSENEELYSKDLANKIDKSEISSVIESKTSETILNVVNMSNDVSEKHIQTNPNVDYQTEAKCCLEEHNINGNSNKYALRDEKRNQKAVLRSVCNKLITNSDRINAQSTEVSDKNKVHITSSVPNLSREEVDKTINLLENTRKELLRFVQNDTKYKQLNKLSRKLFLRKTERNQNIFGDFPQLENSSKSVINNQPEELKLNNKREHKNDKHSHGLSNKKQKFDYDRSHQLSPKKRYPRFVRDENLDVNNENIVHNYLSQKLEIFAVLTRVITGLKNTFDEECTVMKTKTLPHNHLNRENTRPKSLTKESELNPPSENTIINDILDDILATIPSTSQEYMSQVVQIKHKLTQTDIKSACCERFDPPKDEPKAVNTSNSFSNFRVSSSTSLDKETKQDSSSLLVTLEITPNMTTFSNEDFSKSKCHLDVEMNNEM